MKTEYKHTKNGNLTGHLKGSDKSYFEVSEITLRLSIDDAHAIANCLNHVLNEHPTFIMKSQLNVIESVLAGIREIVR